VVRVGIFMKQLQRDRPVFNEAWAEQFGEHRPIPSSVWAGDLGRARDNVAA
jgi:2-iminobutanoate/2-iminopropanoate deaminase